MIWSTISLKDSHLFKITELEIFFKQKLITDSAILNKWESFSGMMDKWRGPPVYCIFSPKIGKGEEQVGRALALENPHLNIYIK